MHIFTNPAINALAIGLLISVGINSVFFLIAACRRTDRVTDLAYSLSFIAIALYSLSTRNGSLFALLPALLVILWALRLGGYLFYRIMKIGRDNRFERMRQHLPRFAAFWALQATTVWIVSAPLLLARTKSGSGPLFYAGLSLWLLGLGIETVSDLQKFRFKNKAENRERWIETGLWRFSRHPNFLGEALLWWGFFLLLLPQLSGWRLLSVISPVFLTLLLRFVSGVPILEKKATEKYGDDPAYQAYRQRTPIFLPGFFRIKSRS